MPYKEEFVYTTDKELGTIFETDNGNRGIEVNIITFGKTGVPKLDIRNWIYMKSGDKKMMKGISLPDDETADRLVDLLLENGYGSENRAANKKAKKKKKHTEEEEE